MSIGYQLVGENPKYGEKMNFAKLARKVEGISPHTAKTWWNRRGEFEDSASLQHRPRSGRPKHKNFDSPQKIEKALEMCEDLKEGQHQFDAAAKLKCSER